MTGHGDVPIAVEALKAGAADFLEKPFDDEQLLAAVTSAIAAERAGTRRGAAVAEITARLATLTPREREVLDQLVAGSAEQDDRLRPRLQPAHCRSASGAGHGEDGRAQPAGAGAHDDRGRGEPRAGKTAGGVDLGQGTRTARWATLTSRDLRRGANECITARHRLVAVVDDDDAVRDSLQFLLEAPASVATYGSAAQFLQDAPLDDLSCLVVDQHMPDQTGLQLVSRLRQRGTPADRPDHRLALAGPGPARARTGRQESAGKAAGRKTLLRFIECQRA